MPENPQCTCSQTSGKYCAHHGSDADNVSNRNTDRPQIEPRDGQGGGR